MFLRKLFTNKGLSPYFASNIKRIGTNYLTLLPLKSSENLRFFDDSVGNELIRLNSLNVKFDDDP